MDDLRRAVIGKLLEKARLIYRGDPARQEVCLGNLMPEERAALIERNLAHVTATFSAAGVSTAEAIAAIEALGAALDDAAQ